MISKKRLFQVLFFVVLVFSSLVISTTPPIILEEEADYVCHQYQLIDCENTENQNKNLHGMNYNCVIDEKSNECTADVWLQYEENKAIKRQNEILTQNTVLFLLSIVLLAILFYHVVRGNNAKEEFLKFLKTSKTKLFTALVIFSFFPLPLNEVIGYPSIIAIIFIAIAIAINFAQISGMSLSRDMINLLSGLITNAIAALFISFLIIYLKNISDLKLKTSRNIGLVLIALILVYFALKSVVGFFYIFGFAGY